MGECLIFVNAGEAHMALEIWDRLERRLNMLIEAAEKLKSPGMGIYIKAVERSKMELWGAIKEVAPATLGGGAR